MGIHAVERGSLWVRQGDGYLCVEAAGGESEKVKGRLIGRGERSIVGWVIENGKVAVSRPGEDSRHYKAIEQELAVKSKVILAFPLLLKDKSVYGAVEVIETGFSTENLNLEAERLAQIQELVDIGSVALNNAIVYERQSKANARLQQRLRSMGAESEFVGQSQLFLHALAQIRSYAVTGYPVLVAGESGTGKELAARMLHRLSGRKEKPFVVQNCSAIPETLLESELFGYEKGAFSGAVKSRLGLFEQADGGSVFLDEIGEMPFALQAKLLRVVQEGEVKPLGSTKVRRVDVRIISATNRDLAEMVSAKQFREDLFYRLSVLPVTLPPLRQRVEDIPLLLMRFLRREAADNDLSPKVVPPETMRILTACSWPGNVRQLENLAKYLTVVVGKEVIAPNDLPPDVVGGERAPLAEAGVGGAGGVSVLGLGAEAGDALKFFGGKSWEDVERAYARYLLVKNNENMTWAAEDAGVNRSTFVARLKRLGVVVRSKRRRR
ncbi:MAG: sigma-54 dependent transcriptional regulator [Desulfobulbaceae bacterium]|nr:sigma-54 dependent transcriptional regulator [Desulfobulbaceae bacterium]